MKLIKGNSLVSFLIEIKKKASKATGSWTNLVTSCIETDQINQVTRLY